MNKIKNYLFLLCTVIIATGLTACSDDDDTLSPTQGQIRFQFSKITTYTLSALDDIYSIIITLEKDGQTITLPSQTLTGDESLLSTPDVALEAGDYKLVSYKAFDYNGNLIDILDIKLESDNEFSIKAGETSDYVLPIKIKTPLGINNYYNTLYGLCMEVLGEDKSKWPKSWDFEKGSVDDTWAGLEFLYDDYGNISELTGIIFDGDPSYNYKDEEQINQALTEFKHMKKLPGIISNLSSLTSISIRNCDLEELPEELKYSNIQSLYVENTNLKALPQSVGEMKYLTHVFLKDNNLTAFPEQLTRLENFYALDIVNERISSIPDNIRNWKSLRSLRITGTDITGLPDVFNDLYKLSTLDLQDNKQLAALPASIKDTRIPYGDNGLYTKKALRALLLDGCAFTGIPEEVQHADIKMLSMADNHITHIDAADIENMPDLTTLILDRNALDGFPRISHSNLGMLSLIGCGLQLQDIDTSGLPALKSDYLFLTQEAFDKIFGPNWDILK